MSSSPIVRLSLPGATAVIAGLTALALVLALELHRWGLWRFAFFALPAVVAVYYLNEYRKLPYEPYHFWPQPPSAPPAASSTSAPASDPVDAEDEPFVDPVEEADRLAAEDKKPAEVEGTETNEPSNPPPEPSGTTPP